MSDNDSFMARALTDARNEEMRHRLDKHDDRISKNRDDLTVLKTLANLNADTKYVIEQNAETLTKANTYTDKRIDEASVTNEAAHNELKSNIAAVSLQAEDAKKYTDERLSRILRLAGIVFLIFLSIIGVGELDLGDLIP